MSESAPPAPVRPESPSTRWLLELAALVALGVTVVAVARVWPELPARVPTLFNGGGGPGGWAGRDSVLAFPAGSIGLYLLLSLVQLLSPHWHNYPSPLTDENREHRERKYRLAKGLLVALKAGICCLFAHLTLAKLETALGRADDFHLWAALGWLVVICVLIAVYRFRTSRMT